MRHGHADQPRQRVAAKSHGEKLDNPARRQLEQPGQIVLRLVGLLDRRLPFDQREDQRRAQKDEGHPHEVREDNGIVLVNVVPGDDRNLGLPPGNRAEQGLQPRSAPKPPQHQKADGGGDGGGDDHNQRRRPPDQNRADKPRPDGPADDHAQPEDHRNVEPARHPQPRLGRADQATQHPDADQRAEHIGHRQAELTEHPAAGEREQRRQRKLGNIPENRRQPGIERRAGCSAGHGAPDPSPRCRCSSRSSASRR